MTLFLKLSLGLALLGGLLILFVAGLAAHVVASGGFFGNGPVAEAQAGEMLAGLSMLVAGALPLALVLAFATVSWNRRPVPGWLRGVGWFAMICLAIPLLLDIAGTVIVGGGFGLLTVPVLPYLAGLLGILLSQPPRDA